MTTLKARPQAALCPQSVLSLGKRRRLRALPQPISDRRMRKPQLNARKYEATVLTPCRF